MALAIPAAASAASVVNGNFESGNLEGWHVFSTSPEVGDWFSYEGTTPPFSLRGKGRGTGEVPPPPQGRYGAVADELDPVTTILYQDVELAPEMKHQLSLRTFYASDRPLAVPTPDTLSPLEEETGGHVNQQFRIDVMRPEAPLESLAPEDLLRTVFETHAGDPASMPPTRMTANLTPFAGQTVRLRFAVAATKEALNAGLDEVSVTSTPPGAPTTGGTGGKGKGSGSGLSLVGHAKALPNGRAILRVRVPGPGRLSAKCPKLLVPAGATPAAARVVTLHLKPTAKAMRALRQKGRLRVKVALAFDPAGSAAIQRAGSSVLLELAGGRRH
jgi:hypothetical protein